MVKLDLREENSRLFFTWSIVIIQFLKRRMIYLFVVYFCVSLLRVFNYHGDYLFPFPPIVFFLRVASDEFTFSFSISMSVGPLSFSPAQLLLKFLHRQKTPRPTLRRGSPRQ